MLALMKIIFSAVSCSSLLRKLVYGGVNSRRMAAVEKSGYELIELAIIQMLRRRVRVRVCRPSPTCSSLLPACTMEAGQSAICMPMSSSSTSHGRWRGLLLVLLVLVCWCWCLKRHKILILYPC